jgi:hypothetical protein
MISNHDKQSVNDNQLGREYSVTIPPCKLIIDPRKWLIDYTLFSDL